MLNQEKMGTETSKSKDQVVKHNRRQGKWIYASTAVLVFACLFMMIGFEKRENDIFTRIEIDVNPSIELAINEKDKVVSATALNEDGVDILVGMELQKVHVTVASNAIFGAMAKKGYLTDINNAILVTVESESSTKKEEIETETKSDWS